MNFRETLDKHLRAIQEKDIPALAATLPDGELALIMADGRLERSAQAFLDLHRGWFGMAKPWRLEVAPIDILETPDMGVALLRLDYVEGPAAKPSTRQESHLTLVFQRRDGKWVMVLDQNTPIKDGAG